MKRTSASQLPPQARRRAQRLIDLYERQAYRTYNLALRITCDGAAAARATESGFLRHLSSSDAESGGAQAALSRETIAAALAEARRQPQARDPDSPRLIRAAIAAATATNEQTARSLASQARESLGAELGITADGVDPKLRDWPWEEPPGEIWERLYPQAHRLLAEREAATSPQARRRGRRAATRSPRGGSALASRLLEGAPSTRARIGDRFAGRSGVWAFRAAVLAFILVPAVVVGLADVGGDGEDSVALSASDGYPLGAAVNGDPASAQGNDNYDALTPKELDALRLKELEELRRYSQQQADESLTAPERSAAAKQAQELLALARRRLAEAERREQALAEREKKAKATQPQPTATPQPAPVSGGKKRKKKGKKKRKPETITLSPEGSISDCLLDQDGRYICPE